MCIYATLKRLLAITWMTPPWENNYLATLFTIRFAIGNNQSYIIVRVFVSTWSTWVI